MGQFWSDITYIQSIHNEGLSFWHPFGPWSLCEWEPAPAEPADIGVVDCDALEIVMRDLVSLNKKAKEKAEEADEEAEEKEEEAEEKAEEAKEKPKMRQEDEDEPEDGKGNQ